MLKVTAVVLVVVLAGFGVAEYLSTSIGEPTLVVYTYSSLFGGPATSAYSEVFDTFANAHHIHIDVEFPSGTLVSTLLAQSNAPSADLVVGLDEITATQAEEHGLLIPYAPPELANVSPELVGEISLDHGVVPYDWGLPRHRLQRVVLQCQ